MLTLRFDRALVPTVALILLAAGCGGPTKNDPPVPIVVAVTPTNATVEQGGTQAFAAAVTGTGTTTVTWKVQETAGGAVSATGAYTAPAKAGTYHVIAASTVNTASTGTATITVPAVAVTISPKTYSLSQGHAYTFTAGVTGAANKSVTWSVQEVGGGTVSSAGLYTAPSTSGTYHVIATSAADNTKSDSAAVTVDQGVVVAVTPQTATLDQGATQSFSAQVTGSTTTSATWAVQEVGGGSIAANGTYTAPTVAGTYHVVATAVADATRTGSAVVTVRPVAIQFTQQPSAAVLTGETFQFQAAVSGTVANGLLWTVDEGNAGGTISAGGLYTAPAIAGTYHVTVTAAADTTKHVSATVVVAAPVSIAINPKTAALLTGATQQFAALVSNASNTSVTWTITESGGGSVNASGLYTAPSAAGTYHVVATSVADASKSDTATVTVAAPVSITISPKTAAVLQNATQQFAASVANTSNLSVTWSVTEVGGGTVDAAGLYTAPATSGVYHVVATSVADGTKSDTATVTVSAPVSITISPKTATVQANATKQFAASVSNTANTAVTWTVTEAGGGAVNATGLYTAPATPGTYHLVATSAADGTKSDTATVAVTSAISVAVSPKTATLIKSSGQAFTAAVSGTTNQGVIWTIQEANGGSISSTGTYAAPTTAGTYTIKAVSAVDPTCFDTAIVTVNAVTVSISPASIDVVKGATAPASFVATVGGAPSNVTWTVSGGGSVANGLFTSSSYASVGAYTVTATSTSDTTVKGTATINTVNPVAITVAPTSATVATGGAQSFVGTVTGSTNTAITWSVMEASGGSIDASGAYTAPAIPGNYHVVATSQADPTKKVYAAITVPNGTDSIVITPDLPSIYVTAPASPSGNTKGLNITFNGTKNTSVTWSIQEGSPAGGTLTYPSATTVTYNAPATPGTYHVIATGVQDSTIIGTATIVVLPMKLYIKYNYATIAALDVNKGGSAYSLTLSADGTYSAKANWTLNDPAAGTLATATNSATCSYTPGTVGGDYTLTATYVSDPSVKTVLNIHVADTGIKVVVTPSSATVAADQHVDLQAIVTGTSNPNVNWAVVGSGNGYISGGETYASYLPPTSKTGTMQISCTSAADTGAKTIVNITVVPAPIKVAVAPTGISVPVGGTLAFNAAVTGNANTNVDWTAEAGGGTIDATGAYTAPSTPGTYLVTATSKADVTKVGTATVTVTVATPAAVSVKPISASISANGKVTLRAYVTGIGDRSLTWSVQETSGGSIAAGTGNLAVYTAPATPGTYHVVATSSADATHSATCTVLVRDAAQANVFMQPFSLTLLQGRSYPFMASVLNSASNTGVTWNALLGGGTFTSNALTAGTTNGTFQVQATSLADSQATAMGTLQVISQPYLETFGFSRTTANTHNGAAAVTLQDGSVLITGGSSTFNDVFDPSANAGQGGLINVGNLASNRYLHTATLLPNGKVLIAGGYLMVSPYGAVATTELYDPATGLCAAGLAMPTTRAYHTATLLRDGRVLLVGGQDSSYNDLVSALLYNPADGTFTPTTGSLVAKRSYHTATLLSDGRVLIAGGTGNYSTLSTTEIFDPATSTFIAGPAMASVRSGHTATLLGDGRVLLAFGGKSSVEVMDISAATSTLVGSAPAAITYHSATLMADGRVGLFGGQAGNAVSKWVHYFDPAMNALTLSSNSLAYGRMKHVSCLLPDGRVLVLGGAGDNGNILFAELMR